MKSVMTYDLPKSSMDLLWKIKDCYGYLIRKHHHHNHVGPLTLGKSEKERSPVSVQEFDPRPIAEHTAVLSIRPVY